MMHMFEFHRLASPFDDDDDDFAFELGHEELEAEIREYADDDDDEFDSQRAGLPILPPAPPARRLPAPSRPAASPIAAAKKAAAIKPPDTPVAAKPRSPKILAKPVAVAKPPAKKSPAPKAIAKKPPSKPVPKNATAKKAVKRSGGKKK